MRDEKASATETLLTEDASIRQIAERVSVTAQKDSTASSLIPHPSSLALWLDRLIVAWLFVLAAFAPLSIAVTQGAWLCGMLLWVLRLMVKPRPRLRRTPLDFALLGFVALTLVSALFSYAPDISFGKMRAVSLFTIVYLVAENVRSSRVVRLLVLVLVASCMVSVLYTFTERVAGRGVKVQGLQPASPLYVAGVRDNDTILQADGRPLYNPEELMKALEAPTGRAEDAGRVLLFIYRYEWMGTFEAERGRLLEGPTALERLGVGSWARGRDWRASGFYGHYVTYAEVLQLVGSVAFGLFVSLRRKRNWAGLLLLLAVLSISGALLLTVTRAATAGFLLSAFLIVTIGASRRAALVVLACALPVVLAGLFILQQKRNVGFLDPKDDSINWRKTVQREGLQLLVSKPRHMIVGVGMDSIKRYWQQWGLFDNGRIPMGHMHSNFLQLALERGLPTLLLWLALLFVYARTLWRLLRRIKLEDWIERGLVLGALGGLAGFVASGVVHYNFGDSEVVMVFYLIMGLCLAIEMRVKEKDRHMQLTSG